MRKIILFLTSVTVSLSLSAQVLPFTVADYSPVTAAMGSASAVQTSSIAYASFSNPAVIPFSESKGDFAVGYSLWQPSSVKTNVIAIAGAYNVNNRIGVTAGFTYGMNPKYDEYDAGGALEGTFAPSQTQINLGFSWRLVEYLALGINMGYSGQKLAEDHSNGAFVTNIFAMTQVKGFKAAVGVANLGTKVTSSDIKFSLPSSLKLGLGYGNTFAQKHSLEINADLDYYFHKAFSAAAGAGYTFNDLLSVRAGYRYGGKSVVPSYASLGLGLKFFGVTIDCAYLIGEKTSPMKNTLCLSAGYRF